MNTNQNKTKMTMTDTFDGLPEDQKAQKIQSLRDMITSAEKTIHGAKAMLLQIEGKKKAGRKKKVEDSEEGNVVQGTFDGQVMIGTDGKQYPVPANYASKSKLVEGDLLKLTISTEGFFIYKQIGPVPRQNKIGIVGQDASGNYFVQVDSKIYRVLLASVTYFKAEPGDEVAIVTSQGDDVIWASIESVLQHNHMEAPVPKASLADLPKEEPSTATGMITGADEAPSQMGDIGQEINAFTENATPPITESMTTEPTSTPEPTQSTPTPENPYAEEAPDPSPPPSPPPSPSPSPSLATPVTPAPIATPTSNAIVDEWVPDIDEIEREIRSEMGIAQPSHSQ